MFLKSKQFLGGLCMRVKVKISCKLCGEKFILRGRKINNQQYDTGFKMCICNNVDQIEIEEYVI